MTTYGGYWYAILEQVVSVALAEVEYSVLRRSSLIATSLGLLA